MAGSPKKRARREEARRREEEQRAAAGVAPPTTALPPANEPPARLTEVEADGDPRDASPLQSPPVPLQGEVLPPVEATHTALKRAMRRRAQEHADRAIEVIAKAMEHPDQRIAVPAAREILDRAHGKPTPDIEVGEGGMTVVILKFGDQ